jgi:PAS domain S-box-containing protein
MHYLPDAVFVLNRDWTISRANARSATLFGYECDELVGMPFETLVPTRLRPGQVTRSDVYSRSLERGRMSPGMSHTMSYRATLLGAKFHITRLDHAETCVVCECPQAA